MTRQVSKFDSSRRGSRNFFISLDACDASDEEEHAKELVQHMRITGDSNFSPVREQRSKTAFTLKDELDRRDHSKENILDRANKKDNGHFGQKNESVEVQSVQSSYTAYDEYNDRPATSGTPRTHKMRRSSEAVIPPNYDQIIMPRERSRSLFEQSGVSLLDESRTRGASVASSSVTRIPEPEISFDEEAELECESTYVDIDTSPTECLDTAHCLDYEDDTCSQASLSSYVVPSLQHDGDEPSIQSNESSLNNGTSHILDAKSSTSIASSEVERRTDISYISSERQSNISSERRSEISAESSRNDISSEIQSDVSAEKRKMPQNVVSVRDGCSRRQSDAFFIGLEEDTSQEEVVTPRKGGGYFIDLQSDIIPEDEGGVRASFLVEQVHFGDYNLRHHIAAAYIQAHWRGVLSRRTTQPLVNQLSLRRYKRYCESLTDTIAQLSAALVKECEVSSLNRSMITNLCLRVKTQSQRPRSSPATPTPPCQACQSRTAPPAAPTLITSTTQTEGILNSLLASFSSPPLNKQNEMFQYDSPGQVPLLQYEATPNNRFERSRTRTHSAASATSPPTSPIRSETSDPTSPARRSHKSSFSELMIHKRTTPPSRVDSPLSCSPSTPSKIVNDNLSCSPSTPSKIINVIDNPLSCGHSPSNNSDFSTAFNNNLNIKCSRTRNRSSESENKRKSDEYCTPRYEAQNNENTNDNNDNNIHLRSSFPESIQPPPEGINESVGMGMAIRNTLNMVKSSLFSSSKVEDQLSASDEINDIMEQKVLSADKVLTLPVNEKSLKDSSSPSTDLRLSLDQFKSLNQLMDESNESNESNLKFSQI